MVGLIALAPVAVRAQATRAKRVAVLLTGSREIEDARVAPYFEEMRRLGWVEGRNISYERMYALGSRDRMAELARAAAAKGPDLVYAPTSFAAGLAKKVTPGIAVVFVTVSDPVEAGLVTSLARPGGNATGAFGIQSDLTMKRFELMREALPALKRVGSLLDAKSSDFLQQKRQHLEAGRPFGFEVSVEEFSTFDEAAVRVTRFRDKGIQVATCASSFTLISRAKDLVELARRTGIPIVAHRVEWAEAGAVLSYGADVTEALRRSAEITHRILNGANPAETPVEQASKFELLLNLNAARALGISLPKVLVTRADRVIE